VEGAPAAKRIREADDTDRVVIIQILDGAWRVCAAHMEPLRFRSAAEAERAGRRVAQTLARLGFDARLDLHDEAGVLTSATPYAAETEALDLRPPPRRQLHS
jgi:hypothetical protein